MKNKIFKISLYGIIGILFVYLFSTTNFSEIINSIKEINPVIIVFLIFLQLTTQFLLCIQWHRITKSIFGASSTYKIFYILSTGSMIEAITPGAKIGGEVTRLFHLKKELKTSTTQSTNIILIQKCISMSVLITFCTISFLFLTTKIHFDTQTRILIGTIGAIMIYILVFLLFFTDKLVVLLNKTDKFSKTKSFVQSYSNSTKLISKKEWKIQLLISTIVWVLFPIKMVILTKSMNLQIDILVIIAITMSSYMIGLLPITPGGIGTFEGTMISLFAMISVENSIAITLSVVFRIITFWFVMLISTMFVLYYKRSKNENKSS